MPYPIIKEADFRRELKSKTTGGYLFFGEEDYMKAAAMRMARTSVTESDPAMAPFNDIHLDGTDFVPSMLLDAMTVPPMGGTEPPMGGTAPPMDGDGANSERKIITVSGLNLGGMKSAEMDKLTEALEAIPDYPYNLIILSVNADGMDYGNLPKKPSALLQAMSEHLVPVYFERNTPAKLAGWVQKHYAAEGVTASPEVCRFTVEYCGRQMYTLASEIDKVAFYVRAKGQNTATESDVRTAAIPAMEYDAFAFTNAITERRRADALDILADLKLRRVDPLYVLSEVSRVVGNLYAVRALADSGRTPAEISAALGIHEYRVSLFLKQVRGLDPDRLKRTLNATVEADLALKRSSTDGYGVIERIICGM